MKRLVSLLLALCLLASIPCFGLAEESLMPTFEMTWPVVDAPIAVTIAVEPEGSAIDFDPETNWMCEYLERHTGLDITWQVIDPASSSESVPMMLNGGSMPDAIIGHWFESKDLTKYGESEMIFYPVNKLFDQMPVFSQYLKENPAVKAGITVADGNIYGFPSICNVYDYPQRFFINTEWLKAAGLEMPKTLAELKEMLVAFRDLDVDGDGDAADETPWAIAWKEASGNQSAARMVQNAFGLVSKKQDNIAIDYSDIDNPKVVFIPLAENYKAYLTYMNDLWTEGLLDPDMMTNTKTEVQAEVIEGSVGFTSMDDPKVYDPDGYEKWETLDILVDQEGDTPVVYSPNKIFCPAHMVINADCEPEKAAALAKLADNMYTVDWYRYAVYGPEAGTEEDYFGYGHYYPEVAEGEARPTNVSYNRAEGLTSDWVHRMTYLSFCGLPGFNQQGYDPYKIAFAEKYPDSAIGKLFGDGVVYDFFLQQQIDKHAPYYVDAVPEFFTSVEDMERMAELKTPLDDYVANQEAKFITGELNLDTDFDAYIETLKQYGAQEYQDIYTKYYETYKANK